MDEKTLSEQIVEFIKARADAKLEKFDKEAKKEISNTPDDSSASNVSIGLKEKRTELEEQFRPSKWLTNAADRAKQMQIVTHAIKYIHTDAKGSSVYAPGGSTQPARMQYGEIISTAILNDPIMDVVGNAAVLDAAGLLRIEHGGKTLINCIKQGDAGPLETFAENEEQLTQWMEGFFQVLSGGTPGSHAFAKQIYFPVGPKKYHLLSPLFPSSLAQSLYDRLAAARYSDEAKAARKSRKESKYNPTLTIDYPNIASQRYGGTKPQNVSQLNTKRGGRVFLLSAAPPSWGSKPKPPLNTTTVFSRNHYGTRVRRESWLLQDFLRRQVGKTSTMVVREQRARYIDTLVDELIQYAAEIQNMTEHAGWSSLPECRLARAEQLWLDPYRARSDEPFAQERVAGEWRSHVADRFARWVNNRIRRKELTPGDAEHREWESLMEGKLRLLKDDLGVTE